MRMAKLEEIAPSSAMSLIYKPFQSESPDILPELDAMDLGETEQNIEEVEEMPEENVNISDESVMDDTIIEERNGVNYITEFNIDKNMKNIDIGFKDLVESVLQKK